MPILTLHSHQPEAGNSASNNLQINRAVDRPMHFLRLALVLQRIDISRTTWLEGVKSGLYPPPIQVGHRNRWISSEIESVQAAMVRGEVGDTLRLTVANLIAQRKRSN